MNCKICNSEFTPKSNRQVYCSKKCKYTADIKARSKKPDNKTCLHCGKDFTPYTSLDKFCSANCRVGNQKSKRKFQWKPESVAKRYGQGNPAYRNGMYEITKKKDNAGTREFMRIRNHLREQMQKEYGYLFCEHCGTTDTYQFEMHHIVFRSEKPKHQYLHDKRNLINLCIKCHNWFHKNKSNRNKLVEARNLIELFGQDILKQVETVTP